MSDWLVHLVQIGGFGKHPNADTLSITQVYGQNVIFRTGTYEKGDLAVFLPPDTVLPTDPEHPILKDNPGLKPGRRIDAVRLRGIFSNGLLVPAKILFTEEELASIPVGTHVAERLGLTKYEDQGDRLATTGENERDPGFMPVYTDIDGWAKYRNAGLINEGDKVVILEKIHGCVDAETVLETLEHGPLTISEIVQKRMNVHVKSASLNTIPAHFAVYSPSYFGVIDPLPQGLTGNVIHRKDGGTVVVSNEQVPSDYSEYKKVLDWSELPSNNDWYEIELADGRKLKVTGNHEVWLPALRCWRRVDQLTVDDEFLVD